MPRGGHREGAGGISTWRHGKTKTIRVPEALAERILTVARQMDSSTFSLAPSIPSQSAESNGDRAIDLSGINLITIGGDMAIKLHDLVAKGYVLKPYALAKAVEASEQRKRRGK